jgi:hypothetical protein
MVEMRTETDSLGVVEVPADKLWGAQTQRSRALQYRQGSDPPRNDHILCYPQEGEGCRTVFRGKVVRPAD